MAARDFLGRGMPLPKKSPLFYYPEITLSDVTVPDLLPLDDDTIVPLTSGKSDPIEILQCLERIFAVGLG